MAKETSRVGVSRVEGRWFLEALGQAVIYGFGTLARPVALLRAAIEEKPLVGCLILTLLQSLSFNFGVRYVHNHKGFAPFLIAPTLPGWFWVLVYALFSPWVMWFLKAAVLNLSAELLGGPPRGLSILCASACAFSPFLLFLPLALLLGYIGGGDLSAGVAAHIWVLLLIVFVAWTAILTFLSLYETYKFTMTKTLGAMFISLFVLLCAWGVGWLAFRF